MSTKQLTARQREIRKALIATRGSVSSAELAAKYGVSRVTIWRDRTMVRRLAPPPADRFDEDTEIQRALAAFQDQEEMVSDELERVDAQANAHAGTTGMALFLNLRANLLGQLRDIEAKRQAFLLSIGWITQAESRHKHTHDYAGMTREQAEKEAAALEGLANGLATDD